MKPLTVAAIALAIFVGACSSEPAPATTTTNPLAEANAQLDADLRAAYSSIDKRAAEARVLTDRIENLEGRIENKDADLVELRELKAALDEELAATQARLTEAMQATTTTSTTVAPTTTTEPPERVETLGPGTHRIADGVVPGTYQSNFTVDNCYWERIGEDREIIDNHFGFGGGKVTIKASDFLFRSEGCGSWLKVD